MSHVVVDASAAIAFLLPSQTTRATQEFFEDSHRGQLIAPSIFTWEVTNVLVRLGLRGVRSAALEQALTAISALEIAVQTAPLDAHVLAIAREALQLGLSVFDTSYLLLAIEWDCPLASRDDRLLFVARRFVPCVDLQGGLESDGRV